MNIDITKNSDMTPLGNWEKEKYLNVCMHACACVSARVCICVCKGEWQEANIKLKTQGEKDTLL